MAHTIEEMREARAALCKEIADKLGEFEDEYSASIENMGYTRIESKTTDAFGNLIVFLQPKFICDVKL